MNGQRLGSTPAVLDLSKSDDHTVELQKDAYRPVAFPITKKVSGTYVVLDVLGGLLPVIVDAATGSWYVLSESSVHRRLEQQGGSAAGQLTPAQLDMVRRGVPVRTFIEWPDSEH